MIACLVLLAHSRHQPVNPAALNAVLAHSATQLDQLLALDVLLALLVQSLEQFLQAIVQFALQVRIVPQPADHRAHSAHLDFTAQQQVERQ